ncbi:AraC family transcriptional regulator [Intestinibacillus massiliensis]|uniref:AraC family transcriptional regulator n=1 Tax=Intestinibacillus massiliensis TaxID=1871029 RepID=UPI000B34CA9F|nr:AraC family transcriptional regulator [Intestinibacillus massiliensis]
MLGHEKGTCSGSDLYFSTPSAAATRMLFYMTACGYYFTNYDYLIERENNHNFLIFYISSGRLSVTSGGRTIVAEPGQVGFLDCHTPHEYHTIGHTEFWWLHLDGSNTRQFYDAVTERNGGFVFPSAAAQAVQQMIYEIVSACRTDQLPHEAKLSNMLYQILTTLLGSEDVSDNQNAQTGNIEAAVQYIKDHYSERISLEDIANYVNISQFHFARVFKKSCGYSPHEFLILTRINHAKHLLKTTALPIKVIAQMVGYQNITTFTNAFSNRVGLSPSAFRKYPI